MNHASEAASDNLKARAYRTIKDRILMCELAPGDVVDQNALVSEIGVSRTPVREAIHALELEGLLVVMPRRGVIVSHILVSDVEHIATAREQVEPMLARMATPHVDPEYLKSLRAAFLDRDATPAQRARADFDLHMHLARTAGNPYLARLMDNVLSQNLRIVVLTSRNPRNVDISSREHVELIDAILAGDADEAERLMRIHMATARAFAQRLDHAQV